MSTYAIGDIQGCYRPFVNLLDKVDFSPSRDSLWIAGDMVNRGPQSLETIEHIMNLGASAKVVLGNHDLHLLAILKGAITPKKSDTLDTIIDSNQRKDIEYWLRQQKLLHIDPSYDYVMVHAGIPPHWSLVKARQLGAEIERVLKSDDMIELYLNNMYGNTPSQWSELHTGPTRWRVITNYFTRMRYCNLDGDLELKTKDGGKDDAPSGYAPWFAHRHRKMASTPIIFGHWAALEMNTGGTPNVFPLDSGCVWGNNLTLMNLDNRELIQCNCSPE